ncbi:MAG: hypothetical protein ACE5RN_08845, partial [Nitrosopumilaceae archaeon]
MQKSRILALALIGIMLSSSSVSVADGYTIWLDTNKINSINFQKNEQRFYNINLIDGVAVNNNQKKFSEEPNEYKIKLYDSTSVKINKEIDDNKFPLKTFYINLGDGIKGNSSDFGGEEDSKIILIKQADERKALWERIFPLDRIRNGVKSL